MKETKSLMNYTKLIALCDFIRQNKEQLTGIGISVATAFANDKGHFDWTITERNMKSAAEAIGVTLTMSGITTQQYSKDLEERVTKLEDTLSALCIQLGYPSK